MHPPNTYVQKVVKLLAKLLYHLNTLFIRWQGILWSSCDHRESWRVRNFQSQCIYQAHWKQKINRKTKIRERKANIWGWDSPRHSSGCGDLNGWESWWRASCTSWYWWFTVRALHLVCELHHSLRLLQGRPGSWGGVSMLPLDQGGPLCNYHCTHK